jgi:hypothetical protein
MSKPRLNIHAIKRAYDNGMLIEDILNDVKFNLRGYPLERAIDDYYRGLTEDAKKDNH